jgi:hypothetical protein
MPSEHECVVNAHLLPPQLQALDEEVLCLLGGACVPLGAGRAACGRRQRESRREGVCVCVYVYKISQRVCVCVCECSNSQSEAYSHMHSPSHTHIHTHTHARTSTQPVKREHVEFCSECVVVAVEAPHAAPKAVCEDDCALGRVPLLLERCACKWCEKMVCIRGGV